ncbi:MAG: hypothetical protein QNK36_21535 [Colwellia sp.]|nr:hypothetical protein [Colwellia sp.]
MQNVLAEKALFIKLGDKGRWEKSCIEKGLLRLGYHDLEHDACLKSDEIEVRKAYPESYDQGAATRHIGQVFKFYHEPETTLWITFYSDRLWWCFSDNKIEKQEDSSKTRPTLNGWSDKDLNGVPLHKGRLSGKLLSVQGFQGTICSVKEKEYLLHKINGTNEPHVLAAEDAVSNLEKALIPIIRNLHPKDLETLTDLIFRQAGWQRTGVAGEVEKDIDLDLLSPITQERIAVQVKSIATSGTYNSYKEKFSDMSGFNKFYFVTHSPNRTLENLVVTSSDSEFIFWGVEELSRQSIRNGLVGWLMDRAS